MIRNGASLCEGPRGARGESRTEPHPKIAPKGPGAKMTMRPRDGSTIAMVGGAGEVGPQNAEWGKALRGLLGTPGELGFDPPPKNSARRSGCQKAPGAPRRVRGRCMYTKLGMGQGFESGVGAPVSSHVQSPTQNIVPEGWGVKMPRSPRDGWAIVLVVCDGEARPPDSEWGNALGGSSGCPWGVSCRASPKNSARHSGCRNAPGGQRRVGYSLVGGVGAFRPRD